MTKIIVTNYKNQSNLYFNVIWDSYLENKNSFSLIKHIDNNSNMEQSDLPLFLDQMLPYNLLDYLPNVFA